MDGIEGLLKSHAALRDELAILTAPFERSHGVGWDDCVALDKDRLSRDAQGLFAAVRRHEAAQHELLAAIARPEADAELRGAFAQGRGSLGEMMKLFSAVVSNCDGEHAHQVRTVLSRLREEIETRLAYEEKILFPKLRGTP